MSNIDHKPVDIMGGDGVYVYMNDYGNYVQFSFHVDEIRIKDMAKKQILQGAAERAELEQKIAKLEARIEWLETRNKKKRKTKPYWIMIAEENEMEDREKLLSETVRIEEENERK